MAESLNPKDIQDSVRKKYADISQSAAGKFNYPTGRDGAIALGYDHAAVKDVSDEILESFCGVGNPFALGPLRTGDRVLDVGCGAGFDLIIARHLVGSSGQVSGIDLTPEMVAKAMRNVELAGLANYEIRLADSGAIPYDDSTFDVIISNGVLNLSPDKEKSFKEIYRVLKPGGRLQFADIVRKTDLPGSVANSLAAWSD
jgi:SAM-dependent methyltransferase